MRVLIGRVLGAAAAAWLLAGGAALVQAAEENREPVARIVVNRTVGEAPLVVCFDGTASLDPEGLPLAYLWDFGDGSARSNLPKVCHEYEEQGSYAAMLEVTDAGGLTGSDVEVVTALAPARVLPPAASR